MGNGEAACDVHFVPVCPVSRVPVLEQVHLCACVAVVFQPCGELIGEGVLIGFIVPQVLGQRAGQDEIYAVADIYIHRFPGFPVHLVLYRLIHRGHVIFFLDGDFLVGNLQQGGVVRVNAAAVRVPGVHQEVVPGVQLDACCPCRYFRKDIYPVFVRRIGKGLCNGAVVVRLPVQHCRHIRSAFTACKWGCPLHCQGI